MTCTSAVYGSVVALAAVFLFLFYLSLVDEIKICSITVILETLTRGRTDRYSKKTENTCRCHLFTVSNLCLLFS